MNHESHYQDSMPSTLNEKEKHFIEDHHFQELLKIREEIYNATEVKPAIKKLVNLVIEKANLQDIRDQLIKQYSGKLSDNN